MSRLTKMYPNGSRTLDASQFPPMAQETIDSEIRNSIAFSEAVKRLAKYEDKEYGRQDSLPPSLCNEELSKVVEVYQHNIAPITSIVRQSMSDWLDSMDADVIVWAIGEAVKNNVRSWKYIEGILKNHFNAGRTTIEAVKASRRSFKAQQETPSSVYDDSGIDYAELERITQNMG